MGRLNNPASVSAGFATNADMQTVLARLPSVGFTSVQYGTIAIAAAAASGTATITSVDTTKSAVIFLGMDSDSAGSAATNYEGATCGLILTNATTVTATRSTTTGSVVVSFVVVYFATATRVQVGTVSCAVANSGTATILSVNLTKTLLLWQGSPSTTNVSPLYDRTRITLTNATTVTANRSGALGTTVTDFVVVEMP